MATAYPGQGIPLYLASSNPREPVYPVTTSIPNGSYSIGIAVNDALGFNIQAVYAVDPGSTTDIEYASEPTFANPEVLGTFAVTKQTQVFTTTSTYPGFVRIRNNSGQTITSATLQKVAATYG